MSQGAGINDHQACRWIINWEGRNVGEGNRHLSYYGPCTPKTTRSIDVFVLHRSQVLTYSLIFHIISDSILLLICYGIRNLNMETGERPGHAIFKCTYLCSEGLHIESKRGLYNKGRPYKLGITNESDYNTRSRLDKKKYSYTFQVHPSRRCTEPSVYLLRRDNRKRIKRRWMASGNLLFQVRSPPCVDRSSLGPCEPYGPVNLDGSRNGLQIVGGPLPLVDQQWAEQVLGD
jgi:hypothetical protein